MAFVTKKIISSWWKLICNYIELKLVIITLLYMYNVFPPKSPLIPSWMPTYSAAILQPHLWETEEIPAATCYLLHYTKRNNSSACEKVTLLYIMLFNQQQLIVGSIEKYLALTVPHLSQALQVCF